MDNRWSEEEVQGLSDRDLLVYQSRLLGAEPGLVMWGGGNTSLKVIETDFRGRETKALLIKASGSDMKVAQRRDFPAVRLDDILPLYDVDEMSDEDLVAFLDHCLLEPRSPRPSIETLLHAFLPQTSVVHTHADAILALTNTLNAREVLDQVFGDDDIAVIEYIRPGFRLSRKVGEAVRNNLSAKGAVLINHGLFTWGDTTKSSYDSHIKLVTLAEEYVHRQAKGKVVFGGLKRRPLSTETRQQVAAAFAPTLRGLVSQSKRMVLSYDDSPEVLEFTNSEMGRELSGIGPATPDHVLQTKRVPLWVEVSDLEQAPQLVLALREGVQGFVEEYQAWYREHGGSEPMLDPYPRVVLVPGLGMWTTGRDSREALIAGDIYRHTIGVIGSAQSVGEYRSLTAGDAFGAEYWPMELYKLTLAPPEKELSRRIALVTGGAHGIGRAIAIRLAAEGAHVAVADIDEASAEALCEELNASNGQGRAMACSMDVVSEASVTEAFKEVRLAFGGLDILVSNAGIAPVGAIETMSLSEWQRALDINTTGHFLVAREAVKLMREQGLGGSMVFMGTKNVTSPGKDFGAYSASKAAEVQLAKVLAIENGEYGIRCNVVNPDAVFEGSNLWSTEVREQRARAHGISVDGLEDFYRQRNLLKERVTAEDVAEAVLFLAGDRSAKTTGAMLPVDAGLRDAFTR